MGVRGRCTIQPSFGFPSAESQFCFNKQAWGEWYKRRVPLLFHRCLGWQWVRRKWKGHDQELGKTRGAWWRWGLLTWQAIGWVGWNPIMWSGGGEANSGAKAWRGSTWSGSRVWGTHAGYKRKGREGPWTSEGPGSSFTGVWWGKSWTTQLQNVRVIPKLWARAGLSFAALGAILVWTHLAWHNCAVPYECTRLWGVH